MKKIVTLITLIVFIILCVIFAIYNKVPYAIAFFAGTIINVAYQIYDMVKSKKR